MKWAISVLMFPTLFLCSCGNSSEKGNWSDADKKKASKAVEKIKDELDFPDDLKDDYLDCYLEKLEDNYNSFADADMDLVGCSSYAKECAEEVENH